MAIFCFKRFQQLDKMEWKLSGNTFASGMRIDSFQGTSRSGKSRLIELILLADTGN
ncbi:Uncharacterized protein DAT39_021402 [Clarias magur]|uniref:Uncharacterized protein n=1 Tax=Clarias magur TaxID=1594786 RepID=A0A8J4TX53_CLAMG|nr:Uncharacterized protein DAT39_021402 [Clarias magur]